MTEATQPDAASTFRSAVVADICRSLLPDGRRQRELDGLAWKLECFVDEGWQALSSGENVESLQSYAAELREVDRLLTAVADSAHRAAAVLKQRMDAVLWNVLTEETGLKPGDVFEQTYERTGYVARVHLDEIALLEPDKPKGIRDVTALMLSGQRVNAKGQLLKRTEAVFIDDFDAIAHLPCVKRPAA
ncbi:hypothetical protein [Burkholderia pyrrocinia]